MGKKINLQLVDIFVTALQFDMNELAQLARALTMPNPINGIVKFSQSTSSRELKYFLIEKCHFLELETCIRNIIA